MGYQTDLDWSDLSSKSFGSQGFGARSSAVEHYVDIVVVTGSIPVAPTILH